MINFKNRRCVGFTLIEIAISILIIGLILTAVLNADSMIQGSRVQDTITIATDLQTAVRTFKERYKYVPGDFSVTAGSPEIPGVSANCISTGAGAGNGNGAIELNESPCVPEHLFAAGFIKGGAGAMVSKFGTLKIIANSASQTFLGPNGLPANVQNVIEFSNLPCAVVQEIDGKLDDGSLSSGKARASVATCNPDTLNDPVPFFAIGL